MRDDESVESRVRSFIERHELVKEVDHLLVAVSGGPDSVALLHLLHRLKDPLGLARISVLHFDHGLRGEESRKDASFVRSLADRLNLPCVMGKEDVRAYGKRHGVSVEMAARACRHRFFQNSMGECSARRVALGHTANDQAEEVLLRLFRGTGPGGLAGMPPKNPAGLIRPILFLTRGEVVAYLHTHELPHREDSTNITASCERNVLRNQVMPLVERHFHRDVVSTLCRSARLARDEEGFWAEEVERHREKVEERRSPTGISLRLHELEGLHPALQRRLLRHAIALLKGDLYGIEAVHVEAALKLALQSTSGRWLQIPGALRVMKEGSTVVITSQMLDEVAEEWTETIVREPGIASFGPFQLCFSLAERRVFDESRASEMSGRRAFLDAEKISWPLTIRNWRPGDRFQPLGMKGSKKLQDFFVDAGVARRARWETPLVCDGEKICWIVGHRIDERVRVGDETRLVLVIEPEAK